MMQFWQNLTDRERLLIQSASCVLVVFVLVIGVYLPVSNARIEAKARVADAEQRYAQVSAMAIEAENLREHKNSGATRNDSSTASDVSERVLISRLAREAGVTISRIQPTDTGALTLWVDSVPSQRLFAWLKDLDANHGLVPDNVSMQPQADETVRAQVQFQGITN